MPIVEKLEIPNKSQKERLLNSGTQRGKLLLHDLIKSPWIFRQKCRKKEAHLLFGLYKIRTRGRQVTFKSL